MAEFFIAPDADGDVALWRGQLNGNRRSILYRWCAAPEVWAAAVTVLIARPDLTTCDIYTGHYKKAATDPRGFRP